MAIGSSPDELHWHHRQIRTRATWTLVLLLYLVPVFNAAIPAALLRLKETATSPAFATAVAVGSLLSSVGGVNNSKCLSVEMLC